MTILIILFAICAIISVAVFASEIKKRKADGKSIMPIILIIFGLIALAVGVFVFDL